MTTFSKTRIAPKPSDKLLPIVIRNYSARLLLFLLLHILFGFILINAYQLVNVHLALCLFLAIVVAAFKAPLSRVSAVVAYIVGAEVLWRMAGASFFWEGGKYAVILVMLIALFRTRSTRIPVAPLFYFLLMLPAIFLTFEMFSPTNAREQISFNLSGPFALCVSCWFFSHVTLNRNDMQILLIAALAPLTSISSLLLSNFLRLGPIVWTTESNFATSAGFGPNQVSTALGMGLLLIGILLIIMPQRKFLRLLLLVLGFWMLMQTILTFSRGGILVGLIGLSILGLHIVASRKHLYGFIGAAILLSLLFIYIFPVLNELTGGTLERRFTDTGLTSRDVLLLEEMEFFYANPVTGVGPGGVYYSRGIDAHTEYSRMLAEHGILGGISLLLMLIMTVRNYFKKQPAIIRGIRGSMIVWSLLTLTHSAMRLSCAPFMFGIGFVTIDFDD